MQDSSNNEFNTNNKWLTFHIKFYFSLLTQCNANEIQYMYIYYIHVNEYVVVKVSCLWETTSTISKCLTSPNVCIKILIILILFILHLKNMVPILEHI